MTVQQMMELLKTLPPSEELYISCHPKGYFDGDWSLRTMQSVNKVHSYYSTKHEELMETCDASESEKTVLVFSIY